MNKIVMILIAAAILIAAFCLGRYAFPKCKPVDTTELEKITQQYEDSILVKNNIIQKMKKDSLKLIALAESINQKYVDLRNTRITTVKKNELTERLITKGLLEFGHKGNNPPTETAIIYGNNYADIYDLQKKHLENQKVKEVAYSGIVKAKDTIIKYQLKVIKTATVRKDKLKTKGGWYIAGIITGMAIPF